MTGVYRTDNQGYRAFSKELHSIETEKGCTIELAVEATGNARFFKNKMETEGFSVLVVNTSEFKVITMSTKKTDANDAGHLRFIFQRKCCLNHIFATKQVKK